MATYLCSVDFSGMSLSIRYCETLLRTCLALGTALVLAIFVPSAAAAPTITEFPIASGNGPQAITLGPDGNVWFVDTGANRIVRVTPGGVMTPFSSGIGASAGLSGIAAGPDGNIYFTESSRNRIGRINLTTFVITESSAMSGGSDPRGITTGPDGALWFTEFTDGEIGRVATGFTLPVVTNEYPIPGSGNNPYGITAGPDGNLWFTELTSAGGIGRITPAGSVTEYGPMTTGLPAGIVAGPDGNLWFAANEDPGAIGKITTSGTITQFSSGLTTNGAPLNMAVGADGNLYFTENAGNRLGQISTSGTITEFTGLTASSGPWGITNGADGNIWFTENAGNRVGRLNFAPAAVTDPATLIQASGATLAGTVTPRSQATTYSFDWGQTTAYGSSTTTSSAGGGASAQPVTAVISGLTPATTYHFRVVATNGAGTTLGADRTLTTLAAAPAATTAAASSVGETNATLAAVVTPNGAMTTYHFDVGLTTGYGDRWPAADVAAGTDSLPHSFEQTLSGLVPGTSYHYRIVATNALGTTYGSDQGFTTAAPAPFAIPAIPQAPAGPTLPPATRPVFGQSATIAMASGEILVQLPGTAVYLPLSAASTVPVGTTIDATRGALKLTNVRSAGGKLQTARFWGGSFTFRQTRGKQSTTVLTLTAPLSCTKSARQLSSATANKPRVRQLWGKDNHGRFVTRGRSAVATVRGTAWFTRDTCEGTLVKVTSGTVAVRDLVRKITVIVRTGHTYLARLK